MADYSTISNLPGSAEAVAYVLWRDLRGHLESPNIEQELTLFRACHKVVLRSDPDSGLLAKLA